MTRLIPRGPRQGLFGSAADRLVPGLAHNTSLMRSSVTGNAHAISHARGYKRCYSGVCPRLAQPDRGSDSASFRTFSARATPPSCLRPTKVCQDRRRSDERDGRRRSSLRPPHLTVSLSVAASGGDEAVSGSVPVQVKTRGSCARIPGVGGNFGALHTEIDLSLDKRPSLRPASPLHRGGLGGTLRTRHTCEAFADLTCART